MRGEIGQARREQVIAATRSLYEERGIDCVSVKDIADRAGITRSLFYHYFSSRDEVTDAILDDYVLRLRECLSLLRPGRDHVGYL
ncbi:TetR/AcrR family transcriptional regulator [Olsenella sp. Marseille-P4559]|uniref:TetR/AcrR family transcriptional regulator n=1 Tax=Olsenella sp. Marseille-P4559 TaxID=2364795 RepID=UPI0010302265|nr:helix-turn-helix domain-containing protein [Olsenella sp. Marseille-P4559]